MNVSCNGNAVCRLFSVATRVLFLTLIAVVAFSSCARKDLTRDRFDRVSVGMTIEQAEAILGPAQRIEASRVPRTPDFSTPKAERRLRPLVRGDEFYQWEEEGTKIIVGLRNGVIQDKWYWEPSL